MENFSSGSIKAATIRLGAQAVLTAIVLSIASLTTALAQTDKPLVYAMYTDIKDWDPSIASSTEVILLSNVYEPLVWYNPNGGKQMFTPGLATSWSVSKDGKTWTFNLRKNVKFHDGGLFDAAVAKASLERTIKLAKGSSFIWGAVESISAPNASTLAIKTKIPAPVDLIASSQYAAYMISPAGMEKGTDWFNQGHGAGTGPYRVRQWNRGQEVVLDRFDDYWGGWKDRQVSRVTLKIVQEAATQVQMIRSGEADFITLPAADLVKTLEKNPAISVDRGPSWRNTQLLLNTRKAPTDNLRFRQALTYAWDYTTVVNSIYEGGAKRSIGVIPATMWGHSPQLKTPSFDLAKAKQLLEGSGVAAQDRRISIAYIGTSEEYKNSLLLFKSNLEKIGVQVDLKPGPWGKIWDDAKGQQNATNLITMTWWPSYATPSDWLIGLFRTEKSIDFNLANYSNPAYDKLVNEGVALEAIDKQAASAKYAGAQQLLLDDAVAIFVADLTGRAIYRKGIKGVALNPAYDAVLFYSLTR
jgi:peptide/nickel transport system substrate-binding protein